MNQQGNPFDAIKQEMDSVQNAYKQKIGELNGKYQSMIQQYQQQLNGNPYQQMQQMQNPQMQGQQMMQQPMQQQVQQQVQQQEQGTPQEQPISMTNEMRMLAILSEIKVILSDIKGGFIKPETVEVEKVVEVEDKKITSKK